MSVVSYDEWPNKKKIKNKYFVKKRIEKERKIPKIELEVV